MDKANATIIDSTIKSIDTWGSSTIYFSNSTIEDICISTSSANFSIINLSPGFFASWDFWLNCSVTLSESGKATDVTLMDTTVTRWSFRLQQSSVLEIINSEIQWLNPGGSSQVFVFNSSLYSLYAGEFSQTFALNSRLYSVTLSRSSIAELTNSTHIYHSLSDDAKIYVNWYLNIHVVDSIGQNVPSANVTATYPNATVAESKLTDANGLARLTLMQKMINATGEYLIGNYNVNATYETHSNSIEVSMTGNKEITVQLPFIIPEFPSAIILPLFIVLTMLAVVLAKRRTARKPKF